MLALTPVTTSIVLGGACYVTTKACRYLCTRPDLDGRVASVFDKVRIKCADFQERVVQYIGKREWSVFSKIFLDNAWISILVVSLLFLNKPQPLTLEEIGIFINGFLSLCFNMWVLRLGIAKYLPSAASSIAAFVAPPNSTT
jgi:hypothetical protein